MCRISAYFWYFNLVSSGADQKKFLQGLCTNDINLLANHGDSIAGSFLTTKGRVIIPAFLTLVQKNGNPEILIEGNDKMIAELKKTLALFKLRSKVSIEITNYKVFCDTDAQSKESVAEVGKKFGDKHLVSYIDPRANRNGTRTITVAHEGKKS